MEHPGSDLDRIENIASTISGPCVRSSQHRNVWCRDVELEQQRADDGQPRRGFGEIGENH